MRVLERLDDYRPLYDALMAEEPGGELLTRYHGTELIVCGGTANTCRRAVIARGPLDIELTLELVDEEGWSYDRPWHYCPEHPPAEPMLPFHV